MYEESMSIRHENRTISLATPTHLCLELLQTPSGHKATRPQRHQQNDESNESHQTITPRLGRRHDSLGLRRRLYHGLCLTLDLLGRYVRLLSPGRGRLELLLELLLQLLLNLLLQGCLRWPTALGGTGGRRRARRRRRRGSSGGGRFGRTAVLTG